MSPQQHRQHRVANRKYARSARGQARGHKYNRSAEGRAVVRKYRRSPKGRAAKRKHNRSAKGRAADRKYDRSAKGRISSVLRVAKRRARKLIATQGDPVAIAKIYGRASELRALGFDVEVDHKIPLARGGAHSAENLRIISAEDNQRKNARLDYGECHEFQ